MATFVQWVARIVTKDPNHPWKWLLEHTLIMELTILQGRNERGRVRDVKARLLFLECQAVSRPTN